MNDEDARSSTLHSQRMKTWISRISCFAGGIFLGAGLMDLLPDVNEAFAKAKISYKIESGYPFPSLFTLLGFFIIFTLEQGVSVMNQHHSADNHHGQHHHQNFGQTLDSMSVGSIEEVIEHNVFKTFSLLFAISLHSIFEGLAVGLQPTYNQTLSMFLALILHKIIIGFSIGINLAKFRVKSDGATNIPHKKTIYIQVGSALLFSIATPIGILIGWGLLGQGDSPVLQMTTAVLQGIACGTFLFIVFCEILPDEFRENSPDRLIKLIFTFGGFVLISVYIFFLPA
ncbi:hypothetical protein Ciccas_000469 [Cichlidogyrus casuarinus]|uniref:Uncharacterized protein n=1 Tax=Cichlidogyrus casuarinus TaxID=1844966 RepID=A0ABD2QNX1_9PLAT